MRNHRIPRLGITGGIGSGKSTALAYVRELGAAVISGDDIVHKLLQEPDVGAAVGARFGDQVLDGAGIDRRSLGAIVFRDDDSLAWLEDLLHPHVKRVFDEWAREMAASPRPPALIAAEIPLLFETGMDSAFDQILVVTAPEELRRQRVSAKLTSAEFDRRAHRQMTDAVKAERANFVFANTGSRRRLKEFVAQVFATMIAETLAPEKTTADEA